MPFTCKNRRQRQDRSQEAHEQSFDAVLTGMDATQIGGQQA